MKQNHEKLICMNIVWFKRDLRITDHAPLATAAALNESILPLYIVEPDMWRLPDTSWRHWHFIHDCLSELRQQLAQLGQPLVIRVGDAQQVFQELHLQNKIKNIYSHEETGNAWTYERDKRLKHWCIQNNIPWIEFPNNGVVRRLKSRDEWGKIHKQRMQQALLAAPKSLRPVANIDIGVLPEKTDRIFSSPPDFAVQNGGHKQAKKTLDSFFNKRAAVYSTNISKPGISARSCSRLSAHITYGTLSVRQIFQQTWQQMSRNKGLDKDDIKVSNKNLSAFLSRMHWHCHFIQKLEASPWLETQCMHPAFEGMRDLHNKTHLNAWLNGQTGYPLVDACMRSLHHNGWLNFRMRAMVVSFASYHLWLDWRQTFPPLAQLFTDYEPGIHISQFQMQSDVTGINSVRIYNPVKQSIDHDPRGKFIRRYVPELAQVPDEWLHEPWKMPMPLQHNTNCRIGIDYPEPIVDHQTSVKFARSQIAERRKSPEFKQQAAEIYDKMGSRKRSPSTKRAKKTARKTNNQQSELEFE